MGRSASPGAGRPFSFGYPLSAVARPVPPGRFFGETQVISHLQLMTDDETRLTKTKKARESAGDDRAPPAWEAALAEVAQGIPAYAAATFPSPMLATVPMFMRHLCRADPGVASEGSTDDYAWMAPLAGGIEGGLGRLAASEGGDPKPFLHAEAQLLIDIKLNFGPAFRDAVAPLVRAATTWGGRPWPKTSRDRVALLAKYLAKDPDVVPALIAAIALGPPHLDNKEADARNRRRLLEQADRAFGDYFARRGSRTYCELIRETAKACDSPGYGILTVQLLKVASYTIKVAVESSRLIVGEVTAALRAEAREKEGKAADVRAVRRERDKAVAAARKEGIATSAERVRLLEARVRELEGQLDTVRRRAAREKAYFEQQRAKAEGEVGEAPVSGTKPAHAMARDLSKEEPPAPFATPAVVPASGAEQRPSLEGRRVFLFTNKERGGAREAFHAELAALGAADPKVYETKGATVPGPKAFPPRSVVIVDTSFMSHSFSSVISRRARAAEAAVLIEESIGIGGLARRLARAMKRQGGHARFRTPM